MKRPKRAMTSYGVNASPDGNLPVPQYTNNELISQSMLQTIGANYLRVFGYESASLRGSLTKQMLLGFPSENIILNIGAGVEYYGSSWALAQWDAHVTELVNLYPNCPYYEIWNEVGNYKTGGNGSYLYLNGAAGYVQMCKDAYAIIKNVNPNGKLVAFGGISTFYNFADYITAMNNNDPTPTYGYVNAKAAWDLGLANYCDAVSMHFYSKNNPNDDASKRYLLTDFPIAYPTGVQARNNLGTMAGMMAQSIQALVGKPIIFSETGCPASGGTENSPAKQSTFLSESFTTLSQYSDLVLWWDMIESSSTAKDPQGHTIDFGLWDYTTSPPTARPSVATFQSFAT